MLFRSTAMPSDKDYRLTEANPLDPWKKRSMFTSMNQSNENSHRLTNPSMSKANESVRSHSQKKTLIDPSANTDRHLPSQPSGNDLHREKNATWRSPSSRKKISSDGHLADEASEQTDERRRAPSNSSRCSLRKCLSRQCQWQSISMDSSVERYHRCSTSTVEQKSLH